MRQDFGYERDHLVIARLDPASAGYVGQKMESLASEIAAHIAGAPGVRGVTYSTNGLFTGTESADALIVPGFNATDPRDRAALEDYVGPDYFAVVGISILTGRGIEAQDTASSLRVAVANEAMVKRFFAGQNPVGRQFRIDDPDWLDKPISHRRRISQCQRPCQRPARRGEATFLPGLSADARSRADRARSASPW